MATSDDDYLCVGICMADPDSGYCLGCGRPPPPVAATTPEMVAENVRPRRLPDAEDNDNAPGPG
ncbi:DUF1289 domain-containing protein [Accumulibacter sp.]|uniref:DUF1289 domain-containing protein n=1 Tax=Accumulibacter sp. TaxID=2053492 RepID=UPI002608C658|nr:DUF1289 domain-containing protein [Accumulibacter sp.]